MSGGETVLILGASAGSGHMIAARALEHALHLARPAARVEVVDVLAVCNVLFRRLYAGGYAGLVRHAPAAMGWLYEMMEHPNGRSANALRVWIQNFNKLPVVRFVRERHPSLILNTHYLPAEIVAQMRRNGELDCPQATITTDFETHRIWIQEPTERYYTATEDGKYYLTTWGAHADKIVVTGIPIRPGFVLRLTRAEARRRCGLDESRPVVLLLTSGFAPNLALALFRELITVLADAQVVTITGRDEQLRRHVEAHARHAGRPARVVGFTETMNEWMQAADLAVSKPGGLTVAESLSSGMPLVIVNPIPGQETRNSDFLLENGAAIKVNNPRLLGYRLGALLRDPPHLEKLRSAALALGRPQAAAAIVADVLRLLSAHAGDSAGRRPAVNPRPCPAARAVDRGC